MLKDMIKNRSKVKVKKPLKSVMNNVTSKIHCGTDRTVQL